MKKEHVKGTGGARLAATGIAAFACWVALSPGVAQAQQFNLQCSQIRGSGTGQVGRLMQQADRGDTRLALRVDVGRRLFCRSECTDNEPFVRMDDTRIVLSEDTGVTSGGRNTTTMTFFRASGQVQVDTITRGTTAGAGDWGYFITLQCRREPFTGLARRRF